MGSDAIALITWGVAVTWRVTLLQSIWPGVFVQAKNWPGKSARICGMPAEKFQSEVTKKTTILVHRFAFFIPYFIADRTGIFESAGWAIEHFFSFALFNYELVLPVAFRANVVNGHFHFLNSGCLHSKWRFKFWKDRLQHGHTPLPIRFLSLVISPLSAVLLFKCRSALSLSYATFLFSWSICFWSFWISDCTKLWEWPFGQ